MAYHSAQQYVGERDHIACAKKNILFEHLNQYQKKQDSRSSQPVRRSVWNRQSDAVTGLHQHRAPSYRANCTVTQAGVAMAPQVTSVAVLMLVQPALSAYIMPTKKRPFAQNHHEKPLRMVGVVVAGDWPAAGTFESILSFRDVSDAGQNGTAESDCLERQMATWWWCTFCVGLFTRLLKARNCRLFADDECSYSFQWLVPPYPCRETPIRTRQKP